ncbi:MAG: cytochrome c oxidase assembly protein [Solirubrobacterales bacterium]
MHSQLAHIAPGPFEPLQPLLAALVVYAYATRARTLARREQPVPAWRQICFYGGLATLLVAVYSPLGELSDELLFAHMAQHLLLADIAALAIVLGLTGPLIAPLLRVRLFDRMRVLSNPLIALPLWVLDLYVWHLPVFYEAALRHELVHGLEHMMFIGFAVNMWMPLFGPLPQPAWFTNFWKLIYIIAVRLIGALLGNVFVWSGTIFYPHYAHGERAWQISPLNDQGLAGTAMMIEGSLLTLGLFAWLFFKAAREGEERQQLVELAQSRGVPLTEERAGRAVAAGRGAALRERIRG